MKKIFITILAVLPAALATAQDEVHTKDGVRRGQVVGIDEASVRLSLPSPLPGQPPARAAIPRADLVKIVFGPDAALDSVKENRTVASTSAARVRWQTLQPFLGVPESRAGEAGNLCGEIHLLSSDPARQEEALAVYRQVEAGAWNPADRETARRGRLRSMMKLGRLEEIAAEVEEIASTSQDPELLIDARLLVAQSRLAMLGKLLDENPRWYEDPPVRAERLRLLHETADNALYPFLFHGTQRAPAARGLGIALELFQRTGDEEAAREIATDLAEIYPESPEAGAAAEILQNKENEKS
jgi:hypothetical protein